MIFGVDKKDTFLLKGNNSTSVFTPFILCFVGPLLPLQCPALSNERCLSLKYRTHFVFLLLFVLCV